MLYKIKFENSNNGWYHEFDTDTMEMHLIDNGMVSSTALGYKWRAIEFNEYMDTFGTKWVMVKTTYDDGEYEDTAIAVVVEEYNKVVIGSFWN